jgi:hypothetical protein
MTSAGLVMPAREQAQLESAPFHAWRFPDGRVWAEFHRNGARVTIRFPGLADFELPPGDAAPLCWPAPGLTEATREHLFLNQVLPLVQGRSGRLSFHASAVATDSGAIAFVGKTGQGKSTLAAAFSAIGVPFLTDDSLVLTEDDGTYLVEPGHPSLRLWDDSREALLAAATASTAAISYSEKARFAAGGALPSFRRSLPLRAAYFLGDPGVPAVRFVRLRGAGLLLEWVRHSFLLDMDEPPALEAHFKAVAAFVADIPCYRLDYPRRYDSLEAVCRDILEHAAGDHVR